MFVVRCRLAVVVCLFGSRCVLIVCPPACVVSGVLFVVGCLLFVVCFALLLW